MFQLENVSKLYRQKEQTVYALQPTDLVIEAGEFVAVVGPSGSGKSTLLTLLGGMLAPKTGKVCFQGRSLYELSVPERAELRRTKMGFVFQTFNLVPYLTAEDNVSVPLLLRGHSGRVRRQRARELLNHLGLADRARHKPTELSIGQQQRVALARALIVSPRILLLDEPFSALDAGIRQPLRTSLVELQETLGFRALLVTHDPADAAIAGQQFRFERGQIVDAPS
jgi:putative ABC transport system ATP-binding protein